MASERDDDRYDDDRYDDVRSSRRDRYDSRDLQDAQSKVKAPAIALMITAVLSLLGIAYSVFSYFVTMKADFDEQRAKMAADPNTPAQTKKDMQAFMDQYEKIVNVALPIDWVIVIFTSIIIFVGALKMKNLQSPAWARASAILAMIPCLSGCCLLGLPVGIWALMVLANSEVKRGFAITARTPNRDDDLR